MMLQEFVLKMLNSNKLYISKFIFIKMSKISMLIY